MLLNEKHIEKINSVIRHFPDNTQFSVAEVDAGEVNYYGVLKESVALKVIDNRSSVFEIASVSKVITSAMLAQLVVTGKLSLTDKISNYLDVNIKNDTGINFTHLANHTSGIPRLPPGMLWSTIFKGMDNPYKNYDESSLLNYLENQHKNKKTGSCSYSNLGVGLLGYLIGRICETDYETALQSLICQPLALKSTTTNRDKIKNQLVEGRDKNGKITPHWDLNILAGAGGIYSNVVDLSKFILANFDKNNQALQLQHQPTHELHKTVKMGLGWHIFNSKGTGYKDWLWHNGATGGFCSEVLIDLENQKGIVLLTNVSGKFIFKANKLRNLVFELMNGE